MRYEIYTNETIDMSREYIPSCEGYLPGSHMKLAYKGEVTDSTSTVDSILNKLFEKFNIDHPEDYKGHSLSVGDVVVLDGSAFTVEPFGWKELPDFSLVTNPNWISSDEYFKNQAVYEKKRRENTLKG